MFQTTIALVFFLFPLAYSPGPGNMFFAANSAQFGFRSTISANFGYHIATFVVTIFIGFGFIAALDEHLQIFLIMKIAGSAYVFWLAWKIFKSGVLEGSETARPVKFLDGVILLALNPKAYVIIALMFTQFLEPSDTDRLLAVILIATIFTVNNFVAFSIWALVGDKIANRFRSPDSAKTLNMMFGLILALVAIWMLL